jgi:hypothetical protein
MVAAKLTNARLIGLGGRKTLPIKLRGRVVASAQVAAEANTQEATSQKATKKAKIYVGKGRFLEDDGVTQYPDRNALTGGFAGGEVGLRASVIFNYVLNTSYK